MVAGGKKNRAKNLNLSLSLRNKKKIKIKFAVALEKNLHTGQFGAAQHSRHIDRKLYKMRELRGAGIVTVKYVPTDDNTADLFTKVLTRQPFDKHRRRVMNLTDK